MSSRRALHILYFCLLARAVFHASVIPMWEGYDEFSHFAYIQTLAVDGRIPVPSIDKNTREIDASLDLAPLPWMLSNEPTPALTHDAFWRLPPADRQARIAALATISPQRVGEPSSNRRPLYEAQQPPIFYMLMALPYRLFADVPLVTRTWIIRILCCLLASLIVFPAYALARELLHSERHALGAVALLCVMPGLLPGIFRISNEALAIPLGALLLWLTVQWRRPLLLGTVLALGLLTKAYFLAAVPVIFYLTLRREWKNPRRLALIIAPALLLAGPWYLRNFRLTGSLSGEQIEAAFQTLPLSQKLEAARRVDWRNAADSAFFSHVWFGNWSFLQVRSWMYRLFAAIYLFALFGVLRRVRNNGGVREVLLFYLFLILALSVHVTAAQATHGLSATTGWYFYVYAAAEAALLTLGLGSGVAIFFLALDWFGAHVLLLPYYAGLIAHRDGGSVPAFHLDQLDVAHLFTNLAVNKPAFLTPWVLIAMWVISLAAGLIAVRQSLKSH